MDPDVGRIHVDEDGHVAQDANSLFRSGHAEIVPLRGEGKLQDLFLGHTPRMGGGGIGQRLRIAAA